MDRSIERNIWAWKCVPLYSKLACLTISTDRYALLVGRFSTSPIFRFVTSKNVDDFSKLEPKGISCTHALMSITFFLVSRLKKGFLFFFFLLFVFTASYHDNKAYVLSTGPFACAHSKHNLHRVKSL